MKRVLCVFLAALMTLSCLADNVSIPGLNGRETVVFDENAFFASSYDYNPDLMRLTLRISLTGFGSSENFGDTGDFGRDSVPKAASESLGFSDFRSYHYDISLNDTSDIEAYAVSHRRLSDGSELVMAVVRCSDYGCHFASNFHMGQSSIHAGFGGAAKELVQTLTGYIDEYLPGKKLKIWITGYSRGAAISNIAAKYLDDMALESALLCGPEDIFAYTYATPTTVIGGCEGEGDEIYANIYNIVSAGDVVPRVPIKAWGYTRFGTDVTLKAGSDVSDGEFEKAVNMYRVCAGETLTREKLAELEDGVNKVENALADTVPTLEDYLERWENLFMYFLEAVRGRVTGSSISDETIASLKKYGMFSWAKTLIRDIDGLSDGWTSAPVLMLLSVFGTGAVDALPGAAALAAVTGAVGEEAYQTALTYMILAVMSAGKIASETGENENLITAEYTPMLLTLAAFMQAFEGHAPAYYMALAELE